MFIKKISIRNFRSIQNCSIDLSDINILFGKNDAGKSNILKALNLFFNNMTDSQKHYNFEDDFCKFHSTPNKKAKEITIELTLQPPKHYKDPQQFIWLKKWRLESLDEYESIFRLTNSKKPVSKSSEQWAKKLIYRYVPATKDNSFFADLLSELYKILSISIYEDLNTASAQLINILQKNTELISADIDKQLHLSSMVNLPTDLSALFRVLDFSTSYKQSSISLSQRGDGIKARHIPSILSFFHTEINRIKNRGEIPSDTIWGYEEPENNLELSAAFEKATEFVEISKHKNIQMLITTHSPSFYSIAKDNPEYHLYYASQNNDITSGTVYSKRDTGFADEQMGLLPFLSPYIKEKNDELIKIKKIYRKLEEDNIYNTNVIFTEGNTDKIIIESLLKKLSKDNLKVMSDRSAGAQWVKNYLCAALFSPKCQKSKFKIYGLVDGDNAGSDAKSEYENLIEESGKKGKSDLPKIIQLKTSNLTNIDNHSKLLINFRKKLDKKFPLGIEEFFPYDVWQYAKHRGWLEKREDIVSFLDKDTQNLLTTDKTLSNILNEDLQFSEEENLYFYFKVSDECKEDFAKYVARQSLDVFSTLKLALADIFNNI